MLKPSLILSLSCNTYSEKVIHWDKNTIVKLLLRPMLNICRQSYTSPKNHKVHESIICWRIRHFFMYYLNIYIDHLGLTIDQIIHNSNIERCHDTWHHQKSFIKKFISDFKFIMIMPFIWETWQMICHLIHVPSNILLNHFGPTILMLEELWVVKYII